MLSNVKKLIIIVGCQRSGTTLTGQILGAPGNCVLLDENDGLYDWFHEYAAAGPDADQKFSEMLGKARRKYVDAESRIVQPDEDEFALAPAIDCLVLKAPNLTYSAVAISRLTVPVFVVYPVRDARSVVSSMLELQHIPFAKNQSVLISKHPDLVAEIGEELGLIMDENQALEVRNALVWKVKSGLYERFAEQSIPVFRFRYEDLIADLRGVCERVADEAGVDFDEQMVKHQTVYRGLGPGKTNRERPVDSESIEKWRTALSQEQQDRIIELTGPMMDSLGYRCGTR